MKTVAGSTVIRNRNAAEAKMLLTGDVLQRGQAHSHAGRSEIVPSRRCPLRKVSSAMPTTVSSRWPSSGPDRDIADQASSTLAASAPVRRPPGAKVASSSWTARVAIPPSPRGARVDADHDDIGLCLTLRQVSNEETGRRVKSRHRHVCWRQRLIDRAATLSSSFRVSQSLVRRTKD